MLQRWRHPVLTAEHTPVFWRYDLDQATQSAPDGAAGHQRRLQPRGDHLRRQVPPGGPRRRGRPQELLRRRREHHRRRRLPLSGTTRWCMPRDRRSRRQRLRHAPGRAPGRLDLRPVLHRAQGPRRAARRPVVGGRAVRHRPHHGPQDRGSGCRTSKTRSPQQRNVVLHPEFVDGKYAFYTRPQDGFIEAGSGGGIGWGLSDTHRARGDRRGEDRPRPQVPHDLRGQERPGPGADQDAARAGCSSRTACATRRRACATCSTPS